MLKYNLNTKKKQKNTSAVYRESTVNEQKWLEISHRMMLYGWTNQLRVIAIKQLFYLRIINGQCESQYNENI